MNNIKLSKTDYLEGLRCPKLLWLRKNRPALAEQTDPQTEYLFETGHRVEEYARQLFPGGVLIGNGERGMFSELLAETEVAMSTTDVKHLYEATFSTNRMICCTDILHRWNSRWNLGEVKSCTTQKPEHLDDLAFQVCCLQDSGHTVEQSYLVHLNNGYIRQSEIDPHCLFIAIDLTKETMQESNNVHGKVQNLIQISQETAPPQQIIGSQCKNPGKCPFYRYCHSKIPQGSIYELPNANKIIPILLSRGIHNLTEIPLTFPLSRQQSALVQSARMGRPVVNVRLVKEFLKQFKYPLFFLDFETISSAIPPYDNSSPYERVPFQFSLHVQETKGGELRHFEFLPESASDPRQRVCEELIDLLGVSGSIVAYNAAFEKSVLTTLAERFPQYSERINGQIKRLVDLIVPFKSGDYSDYRFHGSASIKKVLPALVPSLSYDHLTIGKGDDASLQFQKFVDGQISLPGWRAIRQDLLAYCALDTQAMVEILNVLYKM
jgi:hypothetical protein